MNLLFLRSMLFFIILLLPLKSYSSCWFLVIWTNCDDSVQTEHLIKIDATELVALISEEIRKRSEDVPRNLVNAFTKGTDTVIREQIFPLLTRLEFLRDNTIDQVSDEANKLVDKVFKDIIPLLDNAINVAKDTSRNWTPEKLERHIIITSRDAIMMIEKQLFSDLNDLLDKVYKITHNITEDVACATQSTTLEIMRKTRGYFPEFVNPVDRCRKELKLWGKPSELEPVELFILLECKRLDELGKDTPIQTIVAKYAALEKIAEDLRCISRNTDFGSNKMIEYRTKYAHKAKFWNSLTH